MLVRLAILRSDTGKAHHTLRGVAHGGKEATGRPSRFCARLEAHFGDLVKGQVGDVLFVLALEADQALPVVA